MGPTTMYVQHIESTVCSVLTALSLIRLGLFSAEDVLEAYISVDIAIVTPETEFRAGDLKENAAVRDAVVGAGLATIFGTITAVCNLAE